MATATSQSSGSWSGAIWAGGSGAGGAPADGDAVTIAAGHSVLMDVDLSLWTGLLTVTITGHATTPGMLYWKDGTSGYLKVRTGYNIVGTSGIEKGRLLANSDGVWGNTGQLAFVNKAIILLEGTSQIVTTYLKSLFYCYEPIHKYVETYKTAYTCDQSTGVDVANNILTFGSAPPAAGTAVCVKSSGTLPSGLYDDVIYYTRTVSGNTCKLALSNSDTTIVDITAIGSGTLTMYSGHTDTGTATINVIQNVSAETGWTADAGHDAVVLCNWGPQTYDIQRVTIAAINAGSIQLSENINSVQFPLARIYLSSRNVSVRSSGTSSSQLIFTNASTGNLLDSVFGCEIKNTSGDSTTTFYGRGFGTGYGTTFTGVLSNLETGITGAYFCAASGIIIGCKNMSGSSAHYCTFSGTVAGCEMAHNNSSKFQATAGSLFFGVNYAINNCYLVELYGKILGCYSITNNCGWVRAKSVVANSNNSLLGGVCFDILFDGGRTIGNTWMALGANGSRRLIFRNVYYQTIIGWIQGQNQKFPYASRLGFENLNLLDGVNRTADYWGDILETACDGTGDAPSVDPDGGNENCIEASNTQQYLSGWGILPIIEEHRIWLTAGAHTVTYKLQTTYAGISAGNLKLTCWYIGANGVLTEITDAPAIAQRSDDTDWSQTLSVTFTQSVEGWASFSIDLMEYESGNEVYVWPTPTVT